MERIRWLLVAGFVIGFKMIVIPFILIINQIIGMVDFDKTKECVEIDFDFDGDGRIELSEPEQNIKSKQIEIEEIKVIEEPKQVERKIEKIVYRIFMVDERPQRLTCYSRFDGGIEMKGIYANESIDLSGDRLPVSERRIRGNHYTVAVNYEMKEYHEKLICINGAWTHKYRFHVPNYNSEIVPDNSISKFAQRYSTNWYLLFFNSPYFSVPRDRMGCHTKRNSNGQIVTRDKYSQEDRMDVLFTSAGNSATIRDRQRAWARNTPSKVNVEVWEIGKFAIWNDGIEERIE
jgi:hypothetical protein